MSFINNSKEQLHHLITTNQFKQVFVELSTIATKDANKKLKHDLLDLKADFQQFEIDVVEYIVTKEEQEVYQSKLRRKLIALIEKHEKQPRAISNKVWIISSILLIALLSSLSFWNKKEVSTIPLTTKHEKTVIKGFVKNERQGFIPFAKVLINNRLQAKTNQDGYFEVETDTQIDTNITIQVTHNHYDKLVDDISLKDTLVILVKALSVPTQKPFVQTKAKAFKTVSFKNIKDQLLINKILENQSLEVKKINAAIKVELTFSEEIVVVSNNLYTYHGGFVVLKINDEVCHEFTSLKLENDSMEGNPKKYVLETLETQIMQHLKTNESLIIENIKSCLNQF
ncbi:MAG: hypothetical protein AB8G11_24805 [Saprospiraceae bacterium]